MTSSLQSPHHLSLDDSLLFIRLAQLGTLSAVARERNQPASSVSRALDRIEQCCGLPLVRRSTQGLSLTDEGWVFLRHCERLRSSLDEFATDISSTHGEVGGRVRISASTIVTQHWLVPLLPRLRQQHPRLCIDLIVEDHLVDIVREGIDLAIRTGELLPDGLIAKPLGWIDTGLFASPAYIQAHGHPPSPADLAHHHCLSNCSHTVLNQWPFSRNGASIEIPVSSSDGQLRSDNTATLLAMTLQGLGIAQLPLVAAQSWVQQGCLVPILPEAFAPMRIRVSVLLLPTQRQSARHRAVIDELLPCFSPTSGAAMAQANSSPAT